MTLIRFLTMLAVSLLWLPANGASSRRSASRLPEWAPAEAARLPGAGELPYSADPPDPLVFRDGSRVKDAATWQARRRELLLLFHHYMYGFVPPLPKNMAARVLSHDDAYLGGAATRKVVAVRFGPGRAAGFKLIVVTPNSASKRVPCMFGLDLDSDEKDYASLSVRRGYAFATLRRGDLAQDSPDVSKGVYPLYFRRGQTLRGPHDWGALAVWAWALGVAARQLALDPRIDPARLVVVGHSRSGKAALLAGAMYESIAMVIAHQSGAGGAAPLRTPPGRHVQTVADLIYEYPYWFAGVFASFYDQPQRFPFSVACLDALIAPRPLLIGDSVDGRWTNAPGEFEALKLADPVYRLLGVEGLRDGSMPTKPGSLSGGRLGYYLRSAKGHALSPNDWERFLDYADMWLSPPPGSLEASRGPSHD